MAATVECNNWPGVVTTYVDCGNWVGGIAVTVSLDSEGSLGRVTSMGRVSFWDDADGQACSKAVANACILAKRLRGSFSRAVSTICSTLGAIAGTFTLKGGGGANMC